MEHAMLISPLLRFLLLTAIAAASFSHAIAADPKEKPSRWESAIRKFEQQDEKKSPPKRASSLSAVRAFACGSWTITSPSCR